MTRVVAPTSHEPALVSVSGPRQLRAAEVIAALAFYSMLNFASPYSRLLQPLMGLLAGVVLLTLSRTRALTVLHAAVALWILGSAFVFARGADTGPVGLRLVSALIVPVAVVTVLGARGALRVFTTSLLVTILVSVALAVVSPASGRMSGGEWQGVFQHKNTFGFCCGMFAVVGLAEMLGPRPTLSRQRLLAVGVVAAVVGLVQARSATALGVAVLCVGLTIAASTRHRKGSSAPATALGVCLAAAPLVLLVVASDWAFGLLGRDGTLTGRSEIWRLVLDVRSRSSHPWLGRGLGFWSASNPDALLIWRKVRWTPFSSHNSFLDWWLMLGTVGAVLILLWVGSLLLRSAKVSLVDVRLLGLFPLALATAISSYMEQYLISPIALAVLGLVSASSVASFAR
jgi:exopolysaccharide production protein ExoQ